MTMYDIVSSFLICWLVFVRRKKNDSSNFGLAGHNKNNSQARAKSGGARNSRRQYVYLAG